MSEWLDLSRPSWPRTVGQDHLDADADHAVLTTAAGDADNCEDCWLACTSDGKRHGSDARGTENLPIIPPGIVPASVRGGQ